jgi:hypothetical protein
VAIDLFNTRIEIEAAVIDTGIKKTEREHPHTNAPTRHRSQQHIMEVGRIEQRIAAECNGRPEGKLPIRTKATVFAIEFGEAAPLVKSETGTVPVPIDRLRSIKFRGSFDG